MKFHKMPVNLQQTLIHTGGDSINTIAAFYQLHNNVLIIRPEYRRFAPEIVGTIGAKDPQLIYGDSFTLDTWDKRLSSYCKYKANSLEEGDVLTDVSPIVEGINYN